MTSRLLSQIFNQNSASIYETLMERDAAGSSDSDIDDLEERAGMLPDPPELSDSSIPSNEQSAYELEHSPAEPSTIPNEQRVPLSAALPRSRTNRYTPERYRDEEDNTEVPASLLFEGDISSKPDRDNRDPLRKGTGGLLGGRGRHEARPSTANPRHLREQWNAAAEEYRRPDIRERGNLQNRARLGLIDPKERALWKWANVENLDNFLTDVYDYYIGKGIYNIVLSRVLHLGTLAFVVAFSTFLSLCIDYQKIHTSKKLLDITDSHCMSGMSGWTTFILWSISFYWVSLFTQCILDLRRLWDIHNFYIYLLEIPDSDMQTISWQEVVARLMVLRDANPNTSTSIKNRNYSNNSKQRMDAHDIANRLMRKENYLIALFNKDILDLTVPLPFLRHRGSMLTRTLEWNLSLCILDFVFNEQGQIRTLFLKDTHRRTLSEGLRRRFLFAGFMNIIFAPFIATYFLLVFLLRNVNDFIKTPARIGHRQYTPLAEWKFREFNELYHLFQLRLKMSYPAAEHYVDQFPKEKTVQVARFVSFVAGSLLGLLAIGSMLDYELIAGFEITPGLNALSCIGILTTIVAISRGMLPEDYTVYDPEWSIRNVIQHTHYMPEAWNNKLHSDVVKRDFMTLYTLKITIFLQEVLGVIFTPFVLWFSLPKCSDKVIDFFREFTVHVDGVGYVCSFAVFNFQKPGQQHNNDVRDEYFSAKDNKMLSSYLGFIDQYHNSQPGRGPNYRRMGNTQMHPMAYSPIMTAEMAGPGGSKWLQDRRFSAQYGGPNLNQSMQRESPSRHHAPLATSTLLDHRHQPHPGLLNRNARAAGFPGNSLREEDEEISLQNTTPRYRSNLGESFMSTRLEESSGTPDGSRSGNAGPGVLDLLNQFVGGGHAGEGTGRAGVV